MKCGKQIKEGIDIHLSMTSAAAFQYIFSILEKVGIKDAERVCNSYPHELSGGQLQRVLIAMSVACHPRIIIADEPTTALDVTVQKSVLQLFRDLKEEFNSSLIFISHDLGVISEIADRVVVMYKGRVMEEGLVSEVFKNPKHPYTRGLLECRPLLNRNVERLPVIEDFMSVKQKGDNDWEVISKEVGEVPEVIRKKQAITELSHDPGTILSIKELVVRYPKERSFFSGVKSWTEAVSRVSFDIRKGEILGLVGESGSGKSSLGKAILNLTEIAEGEVFYKDKPIHGLSAKEMRPYRKMLQIIFQDPYSTLNPKMKIGNAITEVLKVHNYKGDVKERAIELMEKVGLQADYYSRYPFQFSGGQRQRISIARTLAVEPEFIVCDESVSALDVSVQAQILNLLKDLQDEMGLSYLFISHDLSVVKHMSDRIIVMKEGDIVEIGTPDDIYKSPKSEYTRTLIDAIPGQSE
jgi:peptide/nickel transport system ATP-binding protein